MVRRTLDPPLEPPFSGDEFDLLGSIGSRGGSGTGAVTASKDPAREMDPVEQLLEALQLSELGAAEARQVFPQLISRAQNSPQVVVNQRTRESVYLMSANVLREVVRRLSNPLGALLDGWDSALGLLDQALQSKVFSASGSVGFGRCRLLMLPVPSSVTFSCTG